MLQDAHSSKISEAVSAPVGDTVIIAAAADAWNYIHELIGDLSAAGTMSVIAINLANAERVLGIFQLADGQGLTLQDTPGEDGRPRFEFRPGERAVIRTTSGTFTGSVHRSIRF